MLENMTPRRGKIRALMAGGLVLGVGSAATLAAWTDTEWAWGGGEGEDENLGTGTFEIEQNTTDPAVWVQEEESPGSQLRFSVDATDLSPGDVVYAPIQLRAAAGSEGGDVTLDGAVLAAGDQALFDALTYEAEVGIAPELCNAVDITSVLGVELVAAGSPLDEGSADGVSFSLDAAPDEDTPGAVANVCISVTMTGDPGDDTLQGLTAQPAWAFQAQSN